MQARYYGFQVDPTPPRDPQKKGKVEAGVKYVTRNFWEPRKSTLVDIVQANAALRRWVAETAGMRVHGTTYLRPWRSSSARSVSRRPAQSISAT